MSKNAKETQEYQRQWRFDNQGRIQEYNKKYRKEHPEKHRAAVSAYHSRLKENKDRMIDWLVEKYGGKPCMDCGVAFHWCAMDFDHRPGEVKELKIGALGWTRASDKNIERMELELAKCDLVCSNCHRVRTWVTRKPNAEPQG
jgi:hypothetical protein